jgi:hypothetical protein
MLAGASGTIARSSRAVGPAAATSTAPEIVKK